MSRDDVISALAAALKEGKQGGAAAAAEIVKTVGPSADLALVAECLQAATANLRERAKTQVLSENALMLPPPPDVEMKFAGQTLDSDVIAVFQEAVAKLECTEAKLSLACTCSAWNRVLSHPAFWKTFQLPGFSSATKMKRFLERQPQRFQRTSCFWIRLPHKMKESTVLFLFQIAPVLDELVVYADEPQLGDDFVYLMYNTVDLHEYKLRYQQYEGRGPILTSLPRLQKRLKRLTFKRVFLSVGSFGRFVSASAEDEDAPEGTQPVFHAKCWLESLEAITFFNMPPSKQRRETSKAVIYSLKPLEQTACDLIQGLRTLSSMRLHNPISATTCVLDVSDGRLGLEPFDRAAYRAYAQSLPAPPKKAKRKSVHLPSATFHGMGFHMKERIYQVPEDFVFEVPSAVWAGAGSSRAAGSSTDPLPLEPKSAKGRCVLIPHSMWPDYECKENDGAGWSAVIKTCTAGGIARVQFDTATDDEGRPYPDEHVRLSDLRPLP